jgi:hypothetical protein
MLLVGVIKTNSFRINVNIKHEKRCVLRWSACNFTDIISCFVYLISFDVCLLQIQIFYHTFKINIVELIILHASQIIVSFYLCKYNPHHAEKRLK